MRQASPRCALDHVAAPRLTVTAFFALAAFRGAWKSGPGNMVL